MDRIEALGAPAPNTERLRAERLDERHCAELVALHLDPEVSLYLGGVRSAEATGDYLAVNLEHWARHGFGLWVFRTPDGAFVGRAGVRRLELDDRDEVEIAYALARPFWRLGLASEIARALVDQAFARLGCPSLVGVVAVDNAGSRRLLEKIGFTLEKSLIFKGEPVVCYRLRNGGSGSAPR